MSITSNMSMYSLTLQPAGMITSAVVGSFRQSAPRDQQIVIGHGERLSLVAFEKDTVRTLLTHNVFGIIRSLATCKVPATPRGKFISIFLSSIANSDSQSPPCSACTTRISSSSISRSSNNMSTYDCSLTRLP